MTDTDNPTPDAEFAYRVLDTARRHGLYMNMWVKSGADIYEDEPLGLIDLINDCGTTACVAGWTAALGGYRISGSRAFVRGADVGHVATVARERLGISAEQAKELFYAEESELDAVFRHIFGPRPELPVIP